MVLLNWPKVKLIAWRCAVGLPRHTTIIILIVAYWNVIFMKRSMVIFEIYFKFGGGKI